MISSKENMGDLFPAIYGAFEKLLGFCALLVIAGRLDVTDKTIAKAIASIQSSLAE